jgi:hypothetical protein
MGPANLVTGLFRHFRHPHRAINDSLPCSTALVVRPAGGPGDEFSKYMQNNNLWGRFIANSRP